MIALRRLRQLAVGRRLDFETAVARRVAGTRIVMSDIGLRIDGAAAINGGLHMHTLSETPVAFEHSVGYVNAVDDDGHTGPAWNDLHGTAVGQGRPRRSDQNGQCEACAHGLGSGCGPTLIQRATPKVKGPRLNCGYA